MALLVFIGALAFWALKGADTGWTKTTANEKQIDPVTELEYPVIVERFTPGVDFLAGAFLCAAVLFGISFAFGKKRGEANQESR